MATLSIILAWRIPWMEEPGRLQSMKSQRVRHNWSDWACTHTQYIVRNIWISTSHLQSPPRDFKSNWSERTDMRINLMRSFEAIPALLLLLLLWFLLGRVHVCKCVCACVCRLVDRQQMIFVLFPRAALTKYQKLIVFKLQKICCLTVWTIRSPKSCCLQGHDPSETFKGNLSKLMVACQQPLVLPGW